MSGLRQSVQYTEYHPRWYRPQVSTWWWVLLLEIRALSRGPQAYAAFERWLENPLIVLLNVITLFFVVFHAATWFNVAPRAMAIRLGGKRVPDLWIVGAHYLSWAAISVVIVCLLVRT